MHTFKIELSPEDYWLLRADVKSAEDVLAKLLLLETEFKAMRVRLALPPALPDHNFQFDTEQ